MDDKQLKKFLFDIEKFLRFINRLDRETIVENFPVVQEGSEALIDMLETIVDGIDEDV